MSDERKKASRAPEEESEAAVKQGPMDDAEAEGVVGGTGSSIPRGSDHDPAGSGPNHPYNPTDGD